MTQAGIPFEEVMVRFDSFGPDSHFKATVGAINPAGTVPVLVDGDLAVWDTMAIAEYLAERFPERAVAARRRRPGTRAQHQRRDARRLHRAAQPLHHEHRGRPA